MAESGDTYSNEGDPAAPEGMGVNPDPSDCAQKVGQHACAGAILQLSLQLTPGTLSSDAASSAPVFFVLHVLQEPFNNRFFVLQSLIVGVWLLLL